MSSLPPGTRVASPRALLEVAVRRREALRDDPTTNCYRVLNGAGDGAPDVTVDWLAGVVVLSLYQDVEEAAWLDALESVLGPRAIYLKRRPRTAQRSAAALEVVSPSAPARGEPAAEHTVRERGLELLIRPGQGLSYGLYLDSRDARERVERACGERAGLHVLNLFAYTGAFGVAALRGGAARVLQIDVSRRVLDWAAQNAMLNRFAPAPRDFWRIDAFDALRRLAKGEQRFDVVISDPPSFSSGSGGVFSAERDTSRLAAACAGVVAPGGTLFALCNQVSLSAEAFEAKVKAGIAETGREVARLERSGASALDFPAPPGEAGSLKVLRVSLR